MNRRILTVSELTRYIKKLVDGDAVLNHLWVRGEISNFKHHYSGHMYFTLKDEGSSLKCVMFRSRNENLRFRPEDGLRAIAGGSVSVYERDGAYQLYVEELQPDGLGALNLAFQQLKEKLAREGLFDPVRKRPVPRLPRKVGVVTSPTGAAVRDIINVTRRRFPNVHLVIAPVLVQGEEAPADIARGIRALQAVDGVDVMIVGRGGGSLEELWAFNDERVARAIHACRVPVISAVGHETDFTIADFAADLRAPTPSAAAELAVPDKAAELRALENLTARLHLGLRRRWERERHRLKSALESPVLRRPRDRIDQQRQRLDDLTRALLRGVNLALRQKAGRRDLLAAKLDALSPLAVLGRGYSVCRLLPDGRVLRKATDVAPGDRVNVMLYQGELRCLVEECKDLEEESPDGR